MSLFKVHWYNWHIINNYCKNNALVIKENTDVISKFTAVISKFTVIPRFQCDFYRISSDFMISDGFLDFNMI